MFYQEAVERWGNYQGSAEKPADFTNFWKVGKQEVDQLGLNYEWKTYHFPSNIVDTFELIFQGVGEGTVVCQVLKPKKVETPLPVVIQFHGYHYSSGDWSDKIGLAAEGVMVICMDVRGQGGKSTDYARTVGGTDIGHIVLGMDEGPENLFYRRIYLDCYQLTQIIFTMDDIDPEQVVVYGGSQGGALALACAALEPKIRKAYVQFPFLSDFRGVYSEGVEGSAYHELCEWFKQKDPLHQREEELFQTLNYIDIQHFSEEIKAEVFWGIGLKDTLCPPKSQFSVYNKLRCSKEMICFPDLGHENLPRYNDTIRANLIGFNQKITE